MKKTTLILLLTFFFAANSYSVISAPINKTSFLSVITVEKPSYLIRPGSIKERLLTRIVKHKITKIFKKQKDPDARKSPNTPFIAGLVAVVTFLISFSLLPAAIYIAIASSIFAIISGFSRKAELYDKEEMKKIKAGRIMGIAVLGIIILALLFVLAIISMFTVA